MNRNIFNTLVIAVVIGLGAVNEAAVVSKQTETFDSQLYQAKSKNNPMSVRWSALLRAAQLAEGEQVHAVADFVKDSDWFMRNAALVALDKIDSDIVYDKAKNLIADKSLVVRSAAVEVLSRLNSTEIRKMFSREIVNPINFNGKSSLWIRVQLMEHLIKGAKEEDKTFFSKLLFDQDKKIAHLSIAALEKISDVRFNGETKLEDWKKLVKQKNWL